MAKTFLIVIVALFSVFMVAANKREYAREWTAREYLAVCYKESNNGADKRDGDNGKAIGPYQIWQVYWTDAVQFDSTIGGTYEDCRKREYAEKIIRAYMKRYAPANASFRDMVMIHNGGPTILKRKNSDAYKRASKYADIVMRNLASIERGETPTNK